MKKQFDQKEARSPEEREEEQNKRLAEMVRRGYEEAPWIRSLLDSLQLTPEDITVIDDLEKLPVISREELIEMELKVPPFGGLTNPGMVTDRIFTSPGPVYEPHLTEKDPLWARGYYAAGFRKGDIVLNTFSYHMVAAGLTFHEGLRCVGATVVPSGTANTEAQVQLLRDLNVTAYAGTPSFLMAIIRKSEEMGHNFRADFRLGRASFVAEPLHPILRKTFEEEYGIDTYQMYGATEVGDIAYECEKKRGWHISENVIVEIVDPSTGKKVPSGHLGEVVVTRLNTIFYLFRFGTGDLSSIDYEACLCERTSHKLNGIAGRFGDAVKVRGLFIAPSQLKQIRDHLTDITFELVVTRESHRDIATINIESQGENEPLRVRFAQLFNDICTVKADRIQFVAPGILSSPDVLIRDMREWK